MYETKKFKAFVKKIEKEREKRAGIWENKILNPATPKSGSSIIHHRLKPKALRKSKAIPVQTFADHFAKIVLKEKKRFEKINKQLSAQFLLKEDGTL